MAAKYDWGDGLGKVHSISLAQHKADVAATKTKGKGSAPAGKPIVPVGTYDPGLDATAGQTTRGLQDLVGLAPNTDTGAYGGTTGRDIERAQLDFLRQGGYVQQDYDTGVANTNTQYGRSLDDLLKSRDRTTADYGTNLGTLQRNYDILGTNQNATARKAGVALGGALQQAQDKRTANQALDKAPIDLAYNRAIEDSQTTQGRLGEDKTTALGALLTAKDRQIGPDGELRIATQRSINDLGDTAQKAIREGGYTAADIQAAKLAQFQQMYPGAKLPTTGGVKATTAPRPTGHALTAAPGLPGVKKVKRGNKVTYTTSVSGP